MKIINLTPHKIVLFKGEEIILEIPSSGFVRAKQENTSLGELSGFPLSKVKFGKVEGMPIPKEGTAYVVSQITAAALKEQGRIHDIYIVDSAVRNTSGQIIGCRGFAKI